MDIEEWRDDPLVPFGSVQSRHGYKHYEFLEIEGRYELKVTEDEDLIEVYEMRCLGFGYWLALPVEMLDLVGTPQEAAMTDKGETPCSRPFIYYHPIADSTRGAEYFMYAAPHTIIKRT